MKEYYGLIITTIECRALSDQWCPVSCNERHLKLCTDSYARYGPGETDIGTGQLEQLPELRISIVGSKRPL